MLDKKLTEGQPLYQPSGLGGQFDGAEWGSDCIWIRGCRRIGESHFPQAQRRVPRLAGTNRGKETNMNTLIKMIKDESGASAAEYALILAIVGSGIAIAALILGGAIGNAMNSASNCINLATTAACQ